MPGRSCSGTIERGVVARERFARCGPARPHRVFDWNRAFSALHIRPLCRGELILAKNQHYTPYQQGSIKRYYENRDTLANQKLAEAVSELYACTDDKKAARLWKSVHKALLSAGVGPAAAGKIVDARDLEELAKMIGKLF